MIGTIGQPVDARGDASPSLLARCGPLCRLTISVGLTALCVAVGMSLAFGIQALQGVAPGWPGGPYRVSPRGGLIAWTAGASMGLLVVALWFVWRSRWVQPQTSPFLVRESRARLLSHVAATIAMVGAAALAIWELKGVPVVPGDRTYLAVMVWLALLAALSAVWVPAVFRLDARVFVRASGLPVRVFCPGCGYDLRGLSNLTCPECGRSYAVDELLRAQSPDEGAARVAPRVG
jgi:hypothetical protein